MLISILLNRIENRIVPFTLCSASVSIGTMLLSLVMYALTGHFHHDDRFFPTISSTEHLPPEHYVYVIGFSYCGIALCLTLCVVHLRMIAPAVKGKKWAARTNRVCLAFGIIAGICFTLQTYWPVEHYMHSSTSGAFFYLGIAYCILVTIVTRTQECRAIGFGKMWKAKACLAFAYALCVGFFGLGLLDSYAGRKTFVYYYVETLSEWCAVYAFIMYYMTYCFDANEYKRVKERNNGKGTVAEDTPSTTEMDEEEREGNGSAIRGSEISLTELGDGIPNDISGIDKSDENVMLSLRDGVKEVLTVVTVPSRREEIIEEEVELIEEALCYDSPLIEKGDEKFMTMIGAITGRTVVCAYVGLIAFSVTGFMLLKEVSRN